MYEYIIRFIASLIFQISVIIIFKKINKSTIRLNLKYLIIIFSASIIQSILNGSNTLNWLGSIFTIIYLMIIIPKLYQCEKNEAYFYSIMIWVMCLITDMAMMLTVSHLNIINYPLEDKLIHKAWSTIILSIILLLLYSIPLTVTIHKSLYKKIKKIKIPKIYIIIVVIMYFYFGLSSSINISNKELITKLLIFGIMFICLITYIISIKYQLHSLKETNELLEKNTDTHLQIINSYRMLKHNLENNLLGIKTIANKETRIQIDNLIKEYNESFYVKYDINNLPVGVNGFILEKISKYSKENINFSVNNKIENNLLKSIGTRSYNIFCEALGIALDNALEATIKSNEKIVFIEFKENDKCVIIKIINSFAGNLDLEKIGTLNYTSKEKGHGLGLYSLLGRKNININVKIKNNLFINTIEIKKMS